MLRALIRFLHREADNEFLLTARMKCLLLLGPLLAYAVPVVTSMSLRLALGPEERDAFIQTRLIPEIGPIEIPTFALLLWASCSAVWIALRHRARLGRQAAAGLLALGVGLLLVAGEEASWGQWFLGFETPAAVAEINHQGEFNVHNIYMQGKTELLRALFGLFGLGVIFAAPRMAALASVSAPRILAPWFAVMTVLPIWEAVTDHMTLIPKLDDLFRSKFFSESQELIIAASAVAYLLLLARRHGRGGRAARPPSITPH